MRRTTANQPVVFVLRVFLIPVNSLIGNRLSRVSLYLIRHRDLAGLIPKIPLIEHWLLKNGEEKRKKVSNHAGLRLDGSRLIPFQM